MNARRCVEIHNPGYWPYAARCIKRKGHDRGRDKIHEDAKGKTWTVNRRAASD